MYDTRELIRTCERKCARGDASTSTKTPLESRSRCRVISKLLATVQERADDTANTLNFLCWERDLRIERHCCTSCTSSTTIRCHLSRLWQCLILDESGPWEKIRFFKLSIARKLIVLWKLKTPPYIRGDGVKQNSFNFKTGFISEPSCLQGLTKVACREPTVVVAVSQAPYWPYCKSVMRCPLFVMLWHCLRSRF